MIANKLILPVLGVLCWLCLAGCQAGLEDFTRGYRTLIAPPANTLAAQGGRVAGTQAARLLQTAQIKVATESAELRETAKVEAATAAGSLIDTAQARLVTESAGQVTSGPTQLVELRDTAQALVATQAFANLPVIQTQVAQMGEQGRPSPGGQPEAGETNGFAQALELTQAALLAQIQSTPIPPDVSQAELQWTIQALAATRLAPYPETPIPSFVAGAAPATLVVYHFRPGDRLSAVAYLIRTPLEKLIYLNQLRYPWLASSPEQLVPGMALVVARQPDNGLPVTPPGQVAWSDTPGCDVSRVDWLLPPVECQRVAIEITEEIRQTLGCISLDNPLGYTLKRRVIEGWMLTGADGTYSYGWFIDRGRQAVVVGPALIAASNAYTECSPLLIHRNP
jgi:hypothetical protein